MVLYVEEKEGPQSHKGGKEHKGIPNDEQEISNDEVKEKNHGDKRHKDSRGKGIE